MVHQYEVLDHALAIFTAGHTASGPLLSCCRQLRRKDVVARHAQRSWACEMGPQQTKGGSAISSCHTLPMPVSARNISAAGMRTPKLTATLTDDITQR